MTLSEFLDYALRGLAVTATGLLALAVCHRISASRKHLVAAFTLLAVILLPSLTVLQRLAPISIRVPAVQTRVTPSVAVREKPVTLSSNEAVAAAPVVRNSPAIDLAGLACWGIVGVGLALMARLALSAISLRSMRASLHGSAFETEADSVAREIGLRTTPRVATSEDVKVPIALACVRSLVVLPEEAHGWTPERRRSVMLHEFAHVKRQDGAWQALAEVACAFQWWNPLVWMLRRSVRLEAERAADDMVLMAGVRPAAYAEDLVTIAKSIQKPVTAILVSPMARRSQIQNRVTAILSKGRSRQSASRTGLLSVAATALLATGAIAAVRLNEETGLPTASEPNLPAQNGGTPGTTANGWTAKAADGRTAQAVEVIQAVGGRQYAWKPDGTLISPDKSVARQFSFGADSGPFVIVSMPKRGKVDPRTHVSGGAQAGALAVDGVSYEIVKPIASSFAIHMFDAEWQNVAFYKPDISEWMTPNDTFATNALAHGFRNMSVAKAAPLSASLRGPENPGTEIKCVADNLFWETNDRTMIAELKDGNSEYTLGQWGDSDGKTLQDRWYFRSAPSAMRLITMQARPGAHFSFTGVALRPQGSWPPKASLGRPVGDGTGVSNTRSRTAAERGTTAVEGGSASSGQGSSVSSTNGNNVSTGSAGGASVNGTGSAVAAGSGQGSSISVGGTARGGQNLSTSTGSTNVQGGTATAQGPGRSRVGTQTLGGTARAGSTVAGGGRISSSNRIGTAVGVSRGRIGTQTLSGTRSSSGRGRIGTQTLGGTARAGSQTTGIGRGKASSSNRGVTTRGAGRGRVGTQAPVGTTVSGRGRSTGSAGSTTVSGGAAAGSTNGSSSSSAGGAGGSSGAGSTSTGGGN